MGFQVPVGIKEPFEKLPPGVIRFKIDGGTEGNVGSEDSPCFGIEIQMTAEEPAQCMGISHNARFFLGLRESDFMVKERGMAADPEAAKEETLLATMGRFKAFCAAAGVEIEGKDTDLIYSELTGRSVLGKVEHKVSKDNPDQTNARITRWLPDGTMDPHVTDIPTAAELATPAKGAKAAPAAGPRPVGNGAATPAKPAAPAARPMSARLGARTATATK